MQSVSDNDVQKDFLKSHVLSRRWKVNCTSVRIAHIGAYDCVQ